MIPFRDAPITRKLLLVILMTTSLALLLMAGAVVAYELLTFRTAITTNTGVLAQVISSLTTSSLDFDNSEDAEDILSVLAAEPQITAAAIYDGSGHIFARFPKSAPAELIPAKPGSIGNSLHIDHLTMYKPIIHEEGRPLGTLYLRADLREMYSRLLIYGTLVIITGLTAIAASLSVSTVLQRRITLPIVQLAELARAVSKRQDYSVRAIGHGRDEIGDLTDAFNEMLTRIGEARAALAGSEERLRLALEGSETGTWDWDLVTHRTTWDDYMYPLYGVEKPQWDETEHGFLKLVHPDDRDEVQRRLEEAVASRSFLKLVHPGDRDEVQRRLDEAGVSRSILNIGFRIQGKDGTTRHMAMRGRVFEDADGNPVRMSGVSMDVTVAKQTEEALQKAKETAEAANRAKDEFLAILSHELRTPLTPVLATLAMLEEDPATPPQMLNELEMIRRNVEVEARLIDDLLDVTRIARGKLELHVHTVDSRTLLDHAVSNYLVTQAAQKNLTISVEVDPGAQTHIQADSSRITQVLWNLLQNACKFTPEDGSITIRVANEPAPPSEGGGQPYLTITVADTGIGIDPDTLPRIFDAFEQGERSRTRLFGGLGLGLAVSKAIVGMHSGTLTASSPGKDLGATFTIRLPTVAAPPKETPGPDSAPATAPVKASAKGKGQSKGNAAATAATTTTSPAPAPAATPPAANGARILLVEDHNDTAKQLTRLLTRAGHTVTCAHTLAEARAAANAAGPQQVFAFDLLVSDLGLPDGSGHDLMREFADLYRIPGIALSGYGMEEDVRGSLTAGFSKHLTKPVNWNELKAAIQTLLNGGAALDRS